MTITGAQFARLPKIDLHLHLEGALGRERVERIAALPDNGITPADLPWKQDGFAYSDLPHFIHTMQELLNVCLQTPEDYDLAMYEAVRDLSRQNAVYAEISFDPYRMLERGVPFRVVLDAVTGARDRAADEFGLRAGIIIGTGREHGNESAESVIRQLLEVPGVPVCGIDLHGNEAAAPASDFIESFALARNAGLGIRAHAGEGGNADNVRDAVELLGAGRIGHGIRALEDPAVMVLLKERGTVLDMCPTSNLSLGLVPSLEAHPIGTFLERGVAVSVNTDDPLFFNENITDEYRNLHTCLGFTLDMLKRVTLHAVDGAFLPVHDKEALRGRVVEGHKKIIAESERECDSEGDVEGII